MLEFLDAVDLSEIRLLGILLSGAITLCLIVQAARGDAYAADIHIMLLLAAGTTYLFLMPMYIWRVLVCCNPYWDPLRWSREVILPVFGLSYFGLLLTVASLGIWFYTTYLPGKGIQCEQWGFFFNKVQLDNKAFDAIHTVMYLVIVLVCLSIVLSRSGYWNDPFGTQGQHLQPVRSVNIHMLVMF